MSEEDPPRPELNYRVITFYSYKGGVGRSMALANVAVLLAQMGRRVLVVDFDLEAPGLHRYFKQRGVRIGSRASGQASTGLVELFDGRRKGETLDWRRCVTKIRWSRSSTGLDMIPACGDSADYAELVQGLNWDELFRDHEFGDYLCTLREAWRNEYDVVLIDSRTGMSDIGGICTILLPDALVMLFTANEQSIEGTGEVVRRARLAQANLPVERGRLLAIPMLSRDDRRTEYEQSEKWRLRIADAMDEFFNDWVWKGVASEAVLQKLYFPQVAYWSFGERLPVIERTREMDDPSSLGAAYQRLARLIDADLNWEVLASERDVPDPKTSELEDQARYLFRMRRILSIVIALLIAVFLGIGILGAMYIRYQAEQAEQLKVAEQAARERALAREDALRIEAARREQDFREELIRIREQQAARDRGR